MEIILLVAVIAGWVGAAVGAAMCVGGIAKHGREKSLDEIIDAVRAQAKPVKDERTRDGNALNEIAIGAMTLGASLAITMGAGVLDASAARLGAGLGLLAGVFAMCASITIAWLAGNAPERDGGA